MKKYIAHKFRQWAADLDPPAADTREPKPGIHETPVPSSQVLVNGRLVDIPANGSSIRDVTHHIIEANESGEPVAGKLLGTVEMPRCTATVQQIQITDMRTFDYR